MPVKAATLIKGDRFMHPNRGYVVTVITTDQSLEHWTEICSDARGEWDVTMFLNDEMVLKVLVA